MKLIKIMNKRILNIWIFIIVLSVLFWIYDYKNNDKQSEKYSRFNEIMKINSKLSKNFELESFYPSPLIDDTCYAIIWNKDRKDNKVLIESIKGKSKIKINGKFVNLSLVGSSSSFGEYTIGFFQNSQFPIVDNYYDVMIDVKAKKVRGGYSWKMISSLSKEIIQIEAIDSCSENRTYAVFLEEPWYYWFLWFFYSLS